jgi:hypothetical protein
VIYSFVINFEFDDCGGRPACFATWVYRYHYRDFLLHDLPTLLVLRYTLAVMYEMFSVAPLITDGQVEEDPLHGLYTRQILNSLDFYLWGHLKTLVYAAPVDNGVAFHNRIVDSCQTVRNYPSISEQMRLSIIRNVEAYTESQGGDFEYLL